MNSRISLSVSALVVIDSLRDNQKIEVFKAITNKAIGHKIYFKDDHSRLIYDSIKHQIKVTAKKESKPKQSALTIKERSQNFYDSLKPFLKDYDASLLREFFDYWSEIGENDKKMRFEKETSFQVSRRLKTWQKNQKVFNSSYLKKEEKPSTGKNINIHPDLQ